MIICGTIWREAQLSAYNTSINIVPVSITNCAPCLIDADLHSAVSPEVAVSFTHQTNDARFT